MLKRNVVYNDAFINYIQRILSACAPLVALFHIIVPLFCLCHAQMKIRSAAHARTEWKSMTHFRLWVYKVLGKSVGLCKTAKLDKDQLYIRLLGSVLRIICENFNPQRTLIS